ncbi:WxL domain-containing protein [Enterococcus mundtii]|uniref:WxL domain-containing protein n=1 Tax=Enterococcus mundtii TaxID=53346 RepID=UPI00129C5898|nr:WxL domain-containing protein [Enterococcus mundtii]MRI75197.1 WxL domain-containing protein [Enterococcus mundtii]
MKLVRLATIAALSTTIFVGGTTAVFADEVREVTTDGRVQFRSAGEEDGELEVIPPETGPDVDIDTEVPETTGPLSIVKAATMNFGTQVISNQDQTYDMVAEMQQLAGTEGDENKVPYVSFAQVQDVRGTNAGWDLQVSLSDFTSETRNGVLTGAEIEFVGSRIQYEGSTAANAPSEHADGLKLSPTTGARSVMTASNGQGAGASSVVWGDQADLNAQFADDEIETVTNNAIQLSVPGSTAKDATTYTSTLSWELTSTPSEDGPGVDA